MIPHSLALNANFMTPTDDTYHNLIEDVLTNGNYKGDRTGTGTFAVVGRMARYSLLNGRSPRPTTKAMSDNPERELLWFRNGSSSIKELRDQKIGIWNSWLMPGSAKYRAKSSEELLNQICKKYDGDLVGAFYMVASEYAKVPEGKGVNPFDKYLIKITLKADMKKHVDIYGSEDNFASLEELVLHVASDHKIDLQVLADGDIGPGGYGPQWRHWKDTQLIDEIELEAYQAQGYQHVINVRDNEAFYGKVVVHREIDQLANAIKLLREDPNSRRIIVTAWNPALTWKAALPPCHLYFQFISHELTLEQRYLIAKDRVQLNKYDIQKEVERTGMMDCALRTWNEYDIQIDRRHKTDEELHVLMDQFQIPRRGLYGFVLLRSNDLGLGQPFNVAQYASLTHMVAQCVGMAPLELVWTAVDAHVYANHVDALREQLELESKECIPRIELTKGITDIDAFTIDDIKIIDHEMHKALSDKMPVAV